MTVLRAILPVVLPLVGLAATVEIGFAPGDAESRVVAVIGEARQSIRVAAYSFTSKPITEALIRAKRRGVDVRAVLDKTRQAERNSAATRLLADGIAVRIHARHAIMHHKFLIVDNDAIETGSFNYTASAARKNAENVVIIREDAAAVKKYATEWQRLWDEAAVHPKSPRP